jgi:outer membrane protein
MKLNSSLACLAVTGLACIAVCQEPLTPPIQPKLAPVTTPPAITVPPPPSSPPATPITATEAAQVALKHQPQIALAQAAILAAHGNVLLARDLLVPTASVTAGYAQLYSLPFVGKPNSIGLLDQGFTAGITLSQLVFDFRKTLDSLRANEAQEKVATFSLSATQQSTVLTVKQDFYTLVQDQKSVEVAEANLKDTQDNLALAQARLNSGIGEPGDVVTAQTNAAAATVSLITARTTASTAQVALTLAMGIDPRTPIVPKDSQEPDIPIDDMNSLVLEAVKQRPEIKQQEQLLKSAGYEISAARNYLLPTINAVLSTSEITETSSGTSNTTTTTSGSGNGGTTGTTGSTGSTSTSSSQNSSSTGYVFPKSASIGIFLTWTPFDVLGQRGRLDNAKASAQTSQANLILATQTVVSDVSNAYINLKSAQQRLTTSQAEVTNALEGLRIAEGQYKAGVTTFVTVTNAELNLAQARSDLVNATAALQLSRAAMEHALGRPL